MKEEQTIDVRYLPIKQEMCWEGETREVYGIAAAQGEKILEQIPNVCISGEQAQRLVSILNEQQVSRLHFREILYDLIAEG